MTGVSATPAPHVEPPPDSRSSEGAPQPPARAARLGTGLAALLVAGAVFAVAADGGSYTVGPREGLAIAVWWALGLLVALGLWRLDGIPRPALVAGGFLAAFAVLTGLSAAWAPAPETALIELNRVTLYLGVFAIGVLAPRRGRLSGWTDGLALGLTAIAVLALLSRLFPHLVGTTAVDRTLQNTERLTYPVDYWNGLGMLVALAVPLLLRTAVGGRPEPWRAVALAGMPVIAAVIYLTSSRGGGAVALTGIVVFIALANRRILASFAALLGLGGSVAAALVLRSHDALVTAADSAAAVTQGRSCALLIAVICVATGLIYAAATRATPAAGRRVHVGAPAKAFVAVLIACLAIILVIASHPGRRLDDFKKPPGTLDPGSRSYVEAHLFSGGGSGRWQFWGGALDAWRDTPLSGQGAGSFESWWAQHGSISYFIRDAHSLWLETLGELGVLGLALLVPFFLVPVAAGLTRLRRAPPAERSVLAALIAVVAGFAVGAALDWMWELTAVAAVAILCLGLLSRATPAPRSRAGRDEGARPWTVRAARVAVPALAVLLVLAHGSQLLGQRRLEASASAAGRNDPIAATKQALDARSLEPWASAPPLQLALVAERAGDLPAAQRWIGEALRRNGADWRIWLTSARIATEAGDVRQGASDLQRARALNPRSPIFARP